MPSVDTIRNLTIKATTDGVDDATASVNKLGDAMAGVSVVSDKMTQSSLSNSTSLNKVQNSLDPTYRATTQLSTAQGQLQKALDTGAISQDRYNQLMVLAQTRFDNTMRSTTPFTAALGAVQNQMVALSAGAGPVGVFLASFGPWGLAAAAGVTIAVRAFEDLSGAATEVAQKAQGLQTFSQITGLATDQIQKLAETGANFGISTDTIGTFLDQFSVKLTQARTASGAYYDMVRQINPVLAAQILVTQGEAAQLAILAQAYSQAGEKGNALLQSAGGRGAVQVAPLLGAINSAGSVSGLSAVPGLSPDEIAKMTAALNASALAADHIRTNIGAIAFGSGFLESQAKARQEMEAMTAAVRNFSMPKAWTDFTNWVDTHTGGALTNILGQPSLSAPVSQVTSTALPDLTKPQTPEQLANQYKTYVTALGSAATAQEQFNVKIGEANVALAKGEISYQDYARILASANLQAAAASTQAYVSALGPLATIQDQVNAKMLTLARTQQQFHNLSPQQVADIKQLTTTSAEWSKANEFSSAGAFNFQLATKAAADQVQAWSKELDPSVATRWASAQEVATARVVALKAAAFDATPALRSLHDAQFEQATMFMSPAQSAQASAAKSIDPTDWQSHMSDAGPQMAAFNSQLGQARDLSADFANNFGQALLQAKTPLEALNSALTSFESTLIQMVSKGLVNNAFGGLLSSFHLSLGSTSGTPTTASFDPSTSGGAFYHSGGIVGSEPSFSRFVHPAYFDNAPRFHAGGIAGDEVPIIAQRGEGVFTPGQMAAMGGGSSPNVNVIVNNNHSSANVGVTQQKRPDGGVDIYATITDAVDKHLSNGGADKVMQSRYGFALRPRSR